MGERIDIPEDTVVLDLALMPKGWDVEKWLHLMKTTGLCVVDSFRGASNNDPKPIQPYMLHSRRKMKYKVVEHSDYVKSIKK